MKPLRFELWFCFQPVPFLCQGLVQIRSDPLLTGSPRGSYSSKKRIYGTGALINLYLQLIGERQRKKIMEGRGEKYFIGGTIKGKGRKERQTKGNGKKEGERRK